MAPLETGSNRKTARSQGVQPPPSPLRFSSFPPEFADSTDQDDDRGNDEADNELDEDNNEDDADETKVATDNGKDWYWQCHLCAHINHLPFLFRDFSNVPFTLTQPCTNTSVPVPISQPTIPQVNHQEHLLHQYQQVLQQYQQHPLYQAAQQHQQLHQYYQAQQYQQQTFLTAGFPYAVPTTITYPTFQPPIWQSTPYALYGTHNPAHPAHTPSPTITIAPPSAPITSAPPPPPPPPAPTPTPIPAPPPRTRDRRPLSHVHPAGLTTPDPISLAFATADRSCTGPAQPLRYRGNIGGLHAWPGLGDAVLPAPTGLGTLWREERVGEGSENAGLLGGEDVVGRPGRGGRLQGVMEGGERRVPLESNGGEDANLRMEPWEMRSCTHTRCEGCYDVDDTMRVVRFCGGSEVDARYYEMWRGGIPIVEVVEEGPEEAETEKQAGRGDVMGLRGGGMRIPRRQRRESGPVRDATGESQILIVRSEGQRGVEGQGEVEVVDDAKNGCVTKASSDSEEGFLDQTELEGEKEWSGDESDGGSHGWLETISCVHGHTQDEGGCIENNCPCQDEEQEEDEWEDRQEEEEEGKNNEEGYDGDNEKAKGNEKER